MLLPVLPSHLQHLPVFQATQGAEYVGDAQLVNSGACCCYVLPLCCNCRAPLLFIAVCNRPLLS